MTSRKSHAQRREETQQRLLESACRLFGNKGFDETSLEAIAKDSGLTVTPVYHYFGNKLELFAEVNNIMEQRLLALMAPLSQQSSVIELLAMWDQFIDLCRQPDFARVVLIDAPHILGRDRWQNSPVAQKARELLQSLQLPFLQQGHGEDKALLMRMVMAALAEIAITVGHQPDYDANRFMHFVVNLLPQAENTAA